MLAAITPSHKSYEESHNTLKYAYRAKNIKANVNITSSTLTPSRPLTTVDENVPSAKKSNLFHGNGFGNIQSCSNVTSPRKTLKFTSLSSSENIPIDKVMTMPIKSRPLSIESIYENEDLENSLRALVEENNELKAALKRANQTIASLSISSRKSVAVNSTTTKRTTLVPTRARGGL